MELRDSYCGAYTTETHLGKWGLVLVEVSFLKLKHSLKFKHVQGGIMSLIKVFSIVAFMFSFSSVACADDSASAASTRSENGQQTQELTKEQKKEMRKNRKAVKDLKRELKADGKYSKEDRKKLRALKKEMRKKTESAPAPTKPTEEQINDADSEPETEAETDMLDPE